VVAELFEQFFLAATHGSVAALDACLGWVTPFQRAALLEQWWLKGWEPANDPR
jgi:hypothetical protein